MKTISGNSPLPREIYINKKTKRNNNYPKKNCEARQLKATTNSPMTQEKVQGSGGG